MALKGAIAKEEIASKILSSFDGSFKYDKEIRIPWVENGEVVQIKITLTAAKVNVEPDGDIALPGTKPAAKKNEGINFDDIVAEPPKPTEAEKANVANLLAALNF